MAQQLKDSQEYKDIYEALSKDSKSAPNIIHM